MRAPSPESSCHSSDCEGDKVVHAMKRLKIAANSRGLETTTTSTSLEEFKRKKPSPGPIPSPMVVDDDGRQVHPKRVDNSEMRRKEMMEMLRNQLRQYRSQYSMISEGPDIAPCG